ncbi:hypothetical protein [Nocardia seriolae]|uniref:Uncharacterized protein n=1 Tax=Nocardia seriolae TaxID=37332 RepID=A0A0B8NDQ2_9NOCA|nr:hypothetical protein [Nocardia seriolae]APA98721.1 hypothetical protein NS506_04675 [Nocardia seriolae]MTJ63795.1 hypothetical protein [Nocardia seriolae]MTJ72258.1 hypothetical protein [Nocardia seriolae]MTJ88357.1 hypothetical protein [Nocardia seriolae]MTK32342.1 hypothetical protein [Nocardia seriolae]
MDLPAPPHIVATLALILGAGMVIAVPAAAEYLSLWARMYGPMLVYLAFVEYLAVALGLVRWGVGQLRP